LSEIILLFIVTDFPLFLSREKTIIESMNNSKIYFTYLIGISLFFFLCKNVSCPSDEFCVNLDHLNSLKETIVTVEGKKLSIWAIYAEPSVNSDRNSSYKHIGDEDEGLSCVDDVARAAVLYLKHYKYTGDNHSLTLAKEALDFVIYMETDDGQFYNFVFSDGTVNKYGHTSNKSFGHWAVEGLWALCEGYKIFKDTDPAYAKKLDECIKKALYNILPSNPLSPLSHYGEYKSVCGRSVPAWLIGDGTDQSSIAAVALCAYYEAKPEKETGEITEKLCEGIMFMSGNKPDEFPFGACLSSLAPNEWHAWGSRQMMALSKAGLLLGRKDFIATAEKEANYWITHLNSSTGMIFAMNPYPVIYPHQAYGNEVITEGLLSLYDVTGKNIYAIQAGLMASWLMGNNPAGEPVYDSKTGRVFDGVDNHRVSFSSGAESTICGLMELMDVLRNPVAKTYLDYKEISSHRFKVAEFDGKNFSSPHVIDMNVDIDFKGEYIPYMVYTDGISGEFNISLDGKSFIAFSVLEKSETLLKSEKLSPVSLNEGKHKIKITFVPEISGTEVNIASMIFQPVLENRFFQNSKGKKIAIYKSFKPDGFLFNFFWPYKERVKFYSYDIKGNISEEKYLDFRQKNFSAGLYINPYGYVIIEEK